jgi:hypothetical protein
MATKTVDLGKKGTFKEHPGLLHKHLGIPAGQKIGPERIAKAEHSSNPEIRKEAISAAGFEHMHHAKHKVGAKQIFGRGDQPAPAKKKIGAAEVFGRRR